MTTEALIRKFHDLASLSPDTTPDSDSLIGVFQMFRPDGAAISDVFAELDVGEPLLARLSQLYGAVGDDRRPQGGRDAYFVIRNPPPLDPDLAGRLGTSWLEGVRDLALSLGDGLTAEMLDPIPQIRVLEGLAPKHPKDPAEQSQLLRTMREDVSILVERIDAGPYAPILRPAYYFAACDSMLRDYLMWPFYAAPSGLEDPFASYFQLWRHGVKYRIFGETQVDLYLPRQQN